MEGSSGGFKFNEGMYQMERIHDIQMKMNLCKNFCLRKDETTELYGFQTWYSLLNALYLEFAAKLKDAETEEVDKKRLNIKTWMPHVIKLVPNMQGKTTQRIDTKIWNYVEECLFNYELRLKQLMVKHKISSPEGNDPNKAVIN